MAPVKLDVETINNFCKLFTEERAANPKLSVESFAKKYGETMTHDKFRHWLANYTTEGRNMYIPKRNGRPTRLSMDHIGNLVRSFGRDAALKKLKAQTSESTGLRYMKRVRNSIRIIDILVASVAGAVAGSVSGIGVSRIIKPTNQPALLLLFFYGTGWPQGATNAPRLNADKASQRIKSSRTTYRGTQSWATSSSDAT